MRFPLPPLLLLLCALALPACGPSRDFVRVEKQAGLDGAWHNPDVIVRTKGSTATVYYRDRTIVIEGFESFHGFLDSDEVMLHGDTFEVRLTPDLLEVGYKNGEPQTWRLDDLPADKTAVLAHGKLSFR